MVGSKYRCYNDGVVVTDTMRKGALITAGLALAVLGAWFFLFRDPREIRNFPIAKKGPLLVFGDSLVESVGAAPGHGLTEQLARTLGEPVLNYGVAGDTTRDGLARLDDALAADPRLVIIVLGGNDFLQKIPREETFANLGKIVSAFQETGAAVMVVGVRSGIIGGGADEEFERLAEETGAAYLEDILQGVFGHADLMADAIHPNDQGYTAIVARLAPVVEQLLAEG